MHLKERHKVIHSASIAPQDWLRFVQIPPFPGQWKRIGLADEDLRALEIAIMARPTTGSVIRGSGGVRKARFASVHGDQGKSGSHRVFYVYFPDQGIVLLLAIISKSGEANLTKADLNELARIVERIRALMERGEIK